MSVGGFGVRRSGGSLREFFAMRAFFRDLEGSTVCLLNEPVAMTNGKTAWHLFSAQRRFCKTMRELQHKGLVISHYCWDSGVSSPLETKTRQRHNRAADELGEALGDMLASLLKLLDWVLVTPCCDHDAHNSLKWAIEMTLEDSDNGEVQSWTKDLYMCVESLRNGFDCILQELGPWISACLKFTDEPWSSCASFRTALAVGAEYVDLLVYLEIRYEGSFLLVSSRCADDPEVTSKISIALLQLRSEWLARYSPNHAAKTSPKT